MVTEQRTKEQVEQSALPIDRKLNLTIREAAEYSGLGINLLYQLTASPMCPFVLRVGKKRLIKRRAFEEYLDGKKQILY